MNEASFIFSSLNEASFIFLACIMHICNAHAKVSIFNLGTGLAVVQGLCQDSMARFLHSIIL